MEAFLMSAGYYLSIFIVAAIILGVVAFAISAFIQVSAESAKSGKSKTDLIREIRKEMKS